MERKLEGGLGQVRLANPEERVFAADSICATLLWQYPSALIYAKAYWQGFWAAIVSPVQGGVGHVEPPIWEGLTRSPIIIEECLDPPYPPL